jgi:hypothetical protein
VVGHDDTVIPTKLLYELSIVKGPSGISMDHEDRSPLSFVEVGEAMARREFKFVAFKGV